MQRTEHSVFEGHLEMKSSKLFYNLLFPVHFLNLPNRRRCLGNPLRIPPPDPLIQQPPPESPPHPLIRDTPPESHPLMQGPPPESHPQAPSICESHPTPHSGTPPQTQTPHSETPSQIPPLTGNLLPNPTTQTPLFRDRLIQEPPPESHYPDPSFGDNPRPLVREAPHSGTPSRIPAPNPLIREPPPESHPQTPHSGTPSRIHSGTSSRIPTTRSLSQSGCNHPLQT